MPSKGTVVKKKQSIGPNTNLGQSAIQEKNEKTQADSATSADGHPVHRSDKKWASGDKVLCRYMHSENIYYEAKIMGLKEKDGELAYSIHYPGWSSRHDEVVPQSQALLRFKDYTKEDADKAKEEVKRAQQSGNKKRKVNEKRAGVLDESRSSTPIGEISAKRKSGRRPTSSIELQERRKDLPQVVIPDTLRRILIDDENLINKSYFLPKIPARITVYDIVQKYRESINPSGVSPREFYVENSDKVNALLNPTSENLQRSALGLLDYFEAAIGTILLYKFERPMFNDLHEQLEKEKIEETENERMKTSNEEQKPDSKRVCYSKKFGLPHLLRMFVRFTDMLSYTDWSERSLEAIIRHAQDFVMFLSKNHQDFFNVDEDYILASPDYHKRVWGNQS